MKKTPGSGGEAGRYDRYGGEAGRYERYGGAPCRYDGYAEVAIMTGEYAVLATRERGGRDLPGIFAWHDHRSISAMAARHYRELVTWQLADELESEVVRIVTACPAAMADLRYRAQVLEAATGGPSNIAEGFARKSPGDFCRFLDYAIASIDEADLRLMSGVKRGYFGETTIHPALALARQTRKAAIKLKQTQIDVLKERAAEKRRARRPKPDPETLP